MGRDPVRDRPQPAPDFLVFGRPYIDEEEIAEVVACLRSGWIGTGPRVAAFEREFAAYKQAGGAAAVSSCSAALHLATVVAGIGPGDEVITTPLTFCSTVNAIIHAGGQPVLADIDPQTMTLDPRQVEARITSRTRAVIPVHFAGRMCDMDALGALAGRHRLQVIEDCAHAIEATWHGRPAGTAGDFGCFSFYATKNVTTGEGGMVLARRQQDLDAVRLLSAHGISKDAWRRFQQPGYEHYSAVAVGFKYNMTDLQAALGLHQLRRVAANWTRRQAIWQRYRDALADLPVTLPAPPASGSRHAYHLFTILIDDRAAGLTRDDLLQAMTRLGIGVGVHYLSLAEHPVYRERFGWRPEDWPEAMRIGRQTVSLPLGPGLADDDVDRVIEGIATTIRRR